MFGLVQRTGLKSVTLQENMNIVWNKWILLYYWHHSWGFGIGYHPLYSLYLCTHDSHIIMWGSPIAYIYSFTTNTAIQRVGSMGCLPITLCMAGCWPDSHPGPWFNIRMSSYRYRISHSGDKTVVRPSFLHDGISYTGKTTSLHWFSPLDSIYAWQTYCCMITNTLSMKKNLVIYTTKYYLHILIDNNYVCDKLPSPWFSGHLH